MDAEHQRGKILLFLYLCPRENFISVKKSWYYCPRTSKSQFRDFHARIGKPERALVVFTPRWGTDRIAERGMYCVVEKWEHREMFEAIFQGIKFTDGEGLSLED